MQKPITFTIEENGKQVPVKGLLVDFITSKVEGYLEPSRKGTPKGDPIGFSSMKFLATLLALTSKSLKEQSAGLRVSHGVLRKWRTEPEFKKMVDHHVGDFQESFWNCIERHVTEDFKAAEKWHKLPIRKLAITEPDWLPYDEFQDRSLYGAELISRLDPDDIPGFEGGSFKEMNDFQLLMWREANNVLQDLRGPSRRSPELEKYLQARITRRIQGTIKMLMDLLGKEKISVAERKRAIVGLKYLEDQVASLGTSEK